MPSAITHGGGLSLLVPSAHAVLPVLVESSVPPDSQSTWRSMAGSQSSSCSRMLESARPPLIRMFLIGCCPASKSWKFGACTLVRRMLRPFAEALVPALGLAPYAASFHPPHWMSSMTLLRILSLRATALAHVRASSSESS